jgi:hypothetical protein
LPFFFRDLDSASRKSLFVVPTSTETVLPDSEESPLTCDGLPFYTISD